MLPSCRLCPPLAPRTSFDGAWSALGASQLLPSHMSDNAVVLGQLLKLAPVFLRRAGTSRWLLASRCLLPWLGRDSSHPRFLPQRARGTDPLQVLEGRGVSQPLRGVCVWRDGELGGCGIVVTIWRKVPSCMALLYPGAAERQPPARKRVVLLATPLVPWAHPGWPLPGSRAGVMSALQRALWQGGEGRKVSDACFLSHPVAGTQAGSPRGGAAACAVPIVPCATLGNIPIPQS